MPRSTWQRATITDLLDRTTHFLSAQQIHQELTHQGQPISLATVYRTMQTLTDAGELDVRHTDDGEHLYRRCTRRNEPHHHLLCRHCGTAVDIPSISLGHWVTHHAQEHGFTNVRTTVELDGVCPSCAPFPEQAPASDDHLRRPVKRTPR